MKKIICILLFLISIPIFINAQERFFEDENKNKIEKAEVIEIQKEIKEKNSNFTQQFLKVKTTDGEVIQNVINDLQPVSEKSYVYVNSIYNKEKNTTTSFVQEIYRINKVIYLILFFIIFYILISGKKGLRSIAALSVSVLAVWFLLIPALAAGYDALKIGVLIASIILFFAIFITHKISIISFSSFLGSFISILISTLLAYFSIYFLDISIFGIDKSSQILELYPNMNLHNLLIATIIIGIVGILDDVAVMQAIMVREFMKEEKTNNFKKVFLRSMKVGQEHTAALVNTIVLAYTAVSLPMLLIIFSPYFNEQIQAGLNIEKGMVYSNEFFVVEIARSLIGSFGLILTVPLVTIISIFIYKKHPPKKEKETTKKTTCCHHH